MRDIDSMRDAWLSQVPEDEDLSYVENVLAERYVDEYRDEIMSDIYNTDTTEIDKILTKIALNEHDSSDFERLAALLQDRFEIAKERFIENNKYDEAEEMKKAA